jgi:hypothetical protein
MDLDEVADHLFEGVMAPLVLGGAVTPGHAIGARQAWALGEGRQPRDKELAWRVREARLRRARTLAPVDAIPEPTATDWALGAALNDLFQAANPTFEGLLRRRSAARILDVAAMTIDHARPPATLREALARHTWFARFGDTRRTDTTVSWWTGSTRFLGVPAATRLQAWPDLRRVRVVRTEHPLLELTPLAVDRDLLSLAVAGFLARTPLTDVASCTRAAPPFVWTGRTLELLAAPGGRTLAGRALARLAAADVDAALGAATRPLLAGPARALGGPVVQLLGDRAMASVLAARDPPANPPALHPDAAFARAVGAAAALRALSSAGDGWSAAERKRLVAGLEALSAAAPS